MHAGLNALLYFGGRETHPKRRTSPNEPMLLETPGKTDEEPRYLVIGVMDGKHWSAVITYRGTNIRLISVRRARTEEVALYES